MLKKEVNMLSGSIMKGLLTIAVPIMIMNVLQSLFNIIDKTVLANFGSKTGYSVGAVGVCSYLISLITGLMIGISSGANVVVARNIGKGDTEKIDRAIGTSILFSVVGGLVLTVIGVSCAELFLTWMNCGPNILPEAALYFRLYFLGVPILMLYNFCASILRSTGDSKRPMVYSLVGGGAKVVLNLLFVSVFKMQIVGVALASIISWVIMAVMAFVALAKNKGVVKIKLNKIRFYAQELKEILYIGVPTGLQQALYSIANVVISAVVNKMGDAATTGIAIANDFDGILYQISVAPSLAVMAYVSQNVGAGNIKRAREATWKGMLITVSLGASLGALSAIFSAELSSIMSSDPEIIAFSQQKMVIISSTYFICGINEIMGASMRGLGKPIIATVCTLVYMCLFRFVWVYLIYPLCPTLTFLYFVWPIGWVLSIITILFFYFPTLKVLKKKISLEKSYEDSQKEVEPNAN